ncbi:MAG TPA: Ku protein [Thermoanaerobaculia bacterium]|jgi:DNA end-binding protein Ku|nr:Ku protein [Thermoanaerobaculia bacterium]
MAEEEDDFEPSGGMRPFWSGNITFGLVSVPVGLYSATRTGGFALKMIGPDEAPVHRRYVCSEDGEVLDQDDIVRGYEIEKGKFIVVTDEELEAIEPRKSREIDLQLFVDRQEIDPIYFNRAYFLVPASGTNKAYRLLAEVMEKKDQAGIATFVMRGKEYLVAIIAENGILRAETLRFADEIRKPADVDLPEPAKPPAAMVKKFEEQIAKRAKKLDLHEFLDERTERLEKLVAKKEKQKGAIVQAPVEEREEEGQGGEVVDLLAILSKSLGGTKKPARKAPAKKKAATTTTKKKTKRAASR